MGNTSYCSVSRSARAETLGYYTKDINQIFTQSASRQAHESMLPKNIQFRECCDSKEHPETIPVVLGLDETGSMRQIPHQLVKDGLPTLMSNFIQKGLNDVSLLFLGIGDHECDRYPLQVGQFESGDKELDLWLTRTYLEGNGGGNRGESYLLAWYFAAFHTRTDAFDKRNKKGFLFTIGDEPNLNNLPVHSIKGLMGTTAKNKSFTDKELLAAAQEKYEVFHIVVLHSDQANRSLEYWKEILGQNCLTVDKHEDIPNLISDTVLSYQKQLVSNTNVKNNSKKNNSKIEEKEEVL